MWFDGSIIVVIPGRLVFHKNRFNGPTTITQRTLCMPW
jgi:hypothetical protein